MPDCDPVKETPRKMMRTTKNPIIATIVPFPNKVPVFGLSEGEGFSPDFLLSEFFCVKPITPVIFVENVRMFLLNIFIISGLFKFNYIRSLSNYLAIRCFFVGTIGIERITKGVADDPFQPDTMSVPTQHKGTPRIHAIT
jgi:hypothetical protein